MIVNKIYYALKFGGIKFLITMIVDKITKKNQIEKAIYDIAQNTKKSDYEKKLSAYYGVRYGKKLHLNNPYTFSEKIQWLKLFDSSNHLKTKLADKYEVREWVASKIGTEYLIPLVGAWDKFSDINISELPSKFVLKTNHGCATNVIITNKNNVNWSEVEQIYKGYLSINYAFYAFEPQYMDIKPKIIAEKYIESQEGTLYDYKIHCFNGQPYYIHVIGDRDLINHKAYEAFYDIKWNLQEFTSNTFPKYEKIIEQPKSFDKMLQLAAVLSADFAYVRVDLYELDNGDIKFGEMTFTPASGMYDWNPPETDSKWGDLIKLPDNI